MFEVEEKTIAKLQEKIEALEAKLATAAAELDGMLTWVGDWRLNRIQGAAVKEIIWRLKK